MAIIHASHNGNDSTGNGSLGSPYRTITKAVSVMTASDTVSIECGGTYYEMVEGIPSGTSSNPTILNSYGSGAKPVVAPLENLTGWVSLGGGKWKTTYHLDAGLNPYSSPDLYVVFLNGVQVYKGRGTMFTVTKVGDTITAPYFSGKNFVGAELVWNYGGFVPAILNIASHSGDAIATTNVNQLPQTGQPVFIQNSPDLLTNVGDWSYNVNTKEITMFFGASLPTDYTIQTPTKDYSIFINNRNYITVDNLHLKGGNYSGGYVMGTTNTIVFDRCTVSDTGAHGIRVSGAATSATVKRSTFYTIPEHGVYIGNPSDTNPANYIINPLVEDCSVSNLGMKNGAGKKGADGVSNVGIFFYHCNNAISRRNDLQELGYIGISYHACKGGLCEYNKIHGFSRNRHDGGGVYTWGNEIGFVNLTQTVIRKNVIYDGNTLDHELLVPDAYGTLVFGIYHDDGSRNFLDSQNIIYNISMGGIQHHNNQDMVANKNVVFDCGQTPLMAREDGIVGQFPHRGFNITENKFIARTADQKLIRWESLDSDSNHGNDIGLWGILDNNKYAKPFGSHSNEVFVWYREGNGNFTFDWTFAQFKTAYGYENTGTLSNITGANGQDVNFYYNDSDVSIQATITGTDVLTGQVYNNQSISIPAWDAVAVVGETIVSPAVVSAGTDRTVTLPVNSTTLNGTLTNTTGVWSQVIGPNTATIVNSTNASTTITGLIQGTYQFRLTGANAATDDVIVTVNPAVVVPPPEEPVSTIAIKARRFVIGSLGGGPVNQAPTVNAGSNQSVILPSSNVNLTGLASDDGSIVSYSWTKVIGPNGSTILTPTQASTGVTGLVAGTYVFRLTVTDNLGLTSYDDVLITVGEAVPVGEIDTDEFVGPFSNWTTLSATGNPATDTVNLQAAFNNLTTNKSLYLTGNFQINNQVSRIGGLNLSIICAPNTSFTWVGSTGPENVMFYFNGVGYSRLLQRCTLDGNGKDVTLVYQHHDQLGDNGKVFDTGNEYADTTFKDGSFGVKGGYNSQSSFAETVFNRCYFSNLNVAGTTLGNFNALDIWFYKCHFVNCYRGITNNSPTIGGAGSYHAYKCVFKNSTDSDLYMGNTERNSARECFSIGSNRFYFAGYSGNPSPTFLQKNIILDTVDTAIHSRNHGPLILLDNKIRATSPLNYDPDPTGSLTMVGNSFSGALPTINAWVQSYVAGNLINQTISETEPTYAIAPHVTRNIITVTTTIQAAVNQASAYVGTKPVVYIPSGSYTENVTVAGDIQLIGSNYDNTTINGLISVSDTATLKDMRIVGAGLNITGTPYFDQLQAFWTGITQNSGTSIIVSSGIAYKVGTAVTVNSGNMRIFAAQGAAEGPQFVVGSAANVHITDYWYERSSESLTAPMYPFVNLTTSGYLGVNGGRISSPMTQTPSILSNSAGTLSIVGVNLDDKTTASNDTLLLGTVIKQSPFLSTSNTAKARLIVSRERSNPSQPIANMGTADDSFILPMLANIRANGVPEPENTMIKFYRVRVENSQITIN